MSYHIPFFLAKFDKVISNNSKRKIKGSRQLFGTVAKLINIYQTS